MAQSLLLEENQARHTSLLINNKEKELKMKKSGKKKLTGLLVGSAMLVNGSLVASEVSSEESDFNSNEEESTSPVVRDNEVVVTEDGEKFIGGVTVIEDAELFDELTKKDDGSYDFSKMMLGSDGNWYAPSPYGDVMETEICKWCKCVSISAPSLPSIPNIGTILGAAAGGIPGALIGYYYDEHEKAKKEAKDRAKQLKAKWRAQLAAALANAKSEEIEVCGEEKDAVAKKITRRCKATKHDAAQNKLAQKLTDVEKCIDKAADIGSVKDCSFDFEDDADEIYKDCRG